MVTRSLFSGISGLKTHQTRLDVISNNIANVNTTAFKASRVRFQDVLSQTIEIATAPEGGRGGQNPKQIGLGVMGATISRDMSQGAIEITNKTTDLAISGNGFFILRDGETIAEFYTRDGSFEIDSDGNLVAGSNGFRVQGWNGVFDTQVKDFIIDTTQPVEDVKVDLFQQFGPQATTSIDVTGNLNSESETALDPIRVSWTKNGTSREIEIRFTRVSPSGEGARDLFLWEVFDPTKIDSATGDFAEIATDQGGIEAKGIVEVDENGKIIANYLNVAGNDASDPADFFLSASELSQLGVPESSANLWASNNTTRTFNGYDFIVLDTNGDGDGAQTEEDARIESQEVAANANDSTVNDVTVTVPNAPLSTQPTATFPNGFTQDAVFQTGTSFSGNGALPGNGLGVPVQYIEAVTNEVITKISPDRTLLQLANSNIIDSNRDNPSQDGRLGVGQTGTDEDSLKLFIDGAEYTRIPNAQAFTPGATEFKLDPDNGVITLGSALPNGSNAIVSYSHEVYPTNTRSIPTGSTMTAEFGARVLGANNSTTWTGTSTRTVDLSGFYNPGSMTLTITDVSAGTAETFREVPFSALAQVTGANNANVFAVDPATGAITLGTFSSGAAVEVGDTVTGSYETFRRFGGEQTVAVAVGTTVDAAEAAFPAGFPYIPGSVGTIQLTDVSRGVTETFTEVAFGTTPGTRQFSVNPATNDLVFGTFFGGFAVDEASDTFASVTHNFDFFDTEIGVTDGAGIFGAGNTRGRNDQWRVLEIPQGGAETGELNLWLSGDGFDASGKAERPSPSTTSNYLPTLSATIRAEINYESDDRVNIIIPNGLTKNPNIDPLVDKTPETFQFQPNISQITGNNGNNNQADSGDSASVNMKNPEDFVHATSIQVFDSLGTPHNLTLRFEKLRRNQWLASAIDPTDPDGERLAFQRILAFDEDGKFDATSTIPYESPAADGTLLGDGFTGIYFDPPQAGGAAPPEEGATAVRITPDFSGLMQTAKQNDALVSDQDGFPPGDLESFSFNDQGFVVALFDNGRSRNIARIALQNFVNPAGLVAVGSNMYKDTVNAGKIGSPQRPGFDGLGTIVPGALESSNVDLAVEFVDLIITQRGFQAQSRSITTADQVLQEILALKR